MEVNGRECKEVKIGEHTYWFIENFKGGDVRAVIDLVADDKMRIKEKALVSKLPELFIVLCKRIDSEVIPTVSFLDDLSGSEYIVIQERIIEEVTGLFTEIQ